MSSLSMCLDERIDQIAIEEQRLVPVRMFLTVLAGGILAVHVGIGAGLLFAFASFACELFEQIVVRPLIRRGSLNTRRRLLYLVATTGVNGAWLLPSIFWWMTGEKSLQFIAIMVLNAQMIHGQALMFRSRLALAVGTAAPGMTLLVLMVGFSGFSKLELLSVTLACGGSFGYVMHSAYLNIVSTRMIEQSRAAFQDLANTDPLTRLPNRRRFTELLREFVAMADENGRPFALLLIDLDKFKSINDTVGHDAGDAVLVEAAGRLREAVGERGVVARLGGDEFAILLHGPATTIAAVCPAIVAAFEPKIDFAGLTLRTAPSIGAALCPHDAATDEALFKCADLALYDVKRAGGEGWARGSGKEKTKPLEADLGGSAEITAPGTKAAFPKSELEQTVAVMAALARSSGPLDAATIADTFKPGRNVRHAVDDILVAAYRMGQAASSDGGRTFALRRAA